jgi:hypothetical protein
MRHGKDLSQPGFRMIRTIKGMGHGTARHDTNGVGEHRSDAIMLCGGEASPAHVQAQAMEHVMMVGEWPCHRPRSARMDDGSPAWLAQR